MTEKPHDADAYQLSTQVGYNLRRANQRHLAIFAKHVEGLTPTQFAALARLFELGTLSQNKLGRLTAMDSATIKGVVERLKVKELVASRADLSDQRLRMVELTPLGKDVFERAKHQAILARQETVAPLTPVETETLEALLAKLI